MTTIFGKARFTRAAFTTAAAVLMTSAGLAMAAGSQVMLSGDHEVPPVKTSAEGQGTITIGDDMGVSGSVKTTGVEGMAAHIHEAAAGKNGPVIIPLKKGSDGEWMVPADAKLTDAQYKAYKAGDLYVNVHSAAHKDGEIRGQLKP